MDETGSVLLELERLRGAVNEGLARIDGRLDGTLQRTVEAEKDIESLTGKVTGVERSLLDRIIVLERKVWWAAGVCTVISASGAAAVAQILATR